jgi:hypothetical protein
MVNDIISNSTYPLNEIMMKNKISKQLLYEAETWKRTISFMQAEFVFMKNRIAQILRDMPNNYMLESIEQYQHLFIEMEKSIYLFKIDINDQIELIKKNHELNFSQLNEKLKKQKKLRAEIRLAEKLFNKMKFEFNQSFATKFTKNRELE